MPDPESSKASAGPEVSFPPGGGAESALVSPQDTLAGEVTGIAATDTEAAIKHVAEARIPTDADFESTRAKLHAENNARFDQQLQDTGVEFDDLSLRTQARLGGAEQPVAATTSSVTAEPGMQNVDAAVDAEQARLAPGYDRAQQIIDAQRAREQGSSDVAAGKKIGIKDRLRGVVARSPRNETPARESFPAVSGGSGADNDNLMQSAFRKAGVNPDEFSQDAEVAGAGDSVPESKQPVPDIGAVGHTREPLPGEEVFSEKPEATKASITPIEKYNALRPAPSEPMQDSDPPLSDEEFRRIVADEAAGRSVSPERWEAYEREVARRRGESVASGAGVLGADIPLGQQAPTADAEAIVDDVGDYTAVDSENRAPSLPETDIDDVTLRGLRGEEVSRRDRVNYIDAMLKQQRGGEMMTNDQATVFSRLSGERASEIRAKRAAGEPLTRADASFIEKYDALRPAPSEIFEAQGDDEPVDDDRRPNNSTVGSEAGAPSDDENIARQERINGSIGKIRDGETLTPEVRVEFLSDLSNNHADLSSSEFGAYFIVSREQKRYLEDQAAIRDLTDAERTQLDLLEESEHLLREALVDTRRISQMDPSERTPDEQWGLDMYQAILREFPEAFEGIDQSDIVDEPLVDDAETMGDYSRRMDGVSEKVLKGEDVDPEDAQEFLRSLDNRDPGSALSPREQATFAILAKKDQEALQEKVDNNETLSAGEQERMDEYSRIDRERAESMLKLQDTKRRKDKGEAVDPNDLRDLENYNALSQEFPDVFPEVTTPNEAPEPEQETQRVNGLTTEERSRFDALETKKGTPEGLTKEERREYNALRKKSVDSEARVNRYEVLKKRVNGEGDPLSDAEMDEFEKLESEIAVENGEKMNEEQLKEFGTKIMERLLAGQNVSSDIVRFNKMWGEMRGFTVTGEQQKIAKDFIERLLSKPPENGRESGKRRKIREKLIELGQLENQMRHRADIIKQFRDQERDMKSEVTSAELAYRSASNPEDRQAKFMEFSGKTLRLSQLQENIARQRHVGRRLKAKQLDALNYIHRTVEIGGFMTNFLDAMYANGYGIYAGAVSGIDEKFT